ncbi:FAD-dependent monooxygenase [Mycobacterium stomatepiae]|nr:FAD-dependent monooxygenase [Mycobacterium stomatepiae]MCV7163063.1 FAD-dependent monooxygenase [Mycobacterium stomatepiae]
MCSLAQAPQLRVHIICGARGLAKTDRGLELLRRPALEDHYDVVVVGSRVAGASVALLAARQGHSVLLVDRADFPSDTLSTNYIHQPGIARLRRWGVLEDLVNSGCPEISHTRLQIGDVVIKGSVSADSYETQSFAPRRYVLDTLLAAAAERAGAEVRHRVIAQDIVRADDNRPIGIVLREGPRRFSVRTSLLVGADGIRSTVARLVDAPVTRADPRITCVYYSFWNGLDAGYELYDGRRAWVGAVPTHDAVLVAAYFSQDRFKEIKCDAVHALEEAVCTNAPDLADRMASACRVERMWGTGDQQNYFRQAAGPGWALVGDSGHHKDSITARGITDAIAQAELLVGLVSPVIDDPVALDERLREYWRGRDGLMMPGYESTLRVAAPERWDERRDFAAAIAGSTLLTSLYFDVVAGLKPANLLTAEFDKWEEPAPALRPSTTGQNSLKA